MKRIKLHDRTLPNYSPAEETFHAASHLLGVFFGLAALLICLKRSADLWARTGSCIYGGSFILLYAMSGIYHGLPQGTAKKVLQILDHCTIYLLIAGTYTPVLFCAIRPVSPVCAWVLFALVWGCAAVGTVFTAIDLERYDKLSLICYIAMGWCIVMAAPTAIRAIALPGLLWLLAGGIAYTVGAVFYAVGRNRPWMHGIFHVFVLAGSILQFVSIAGYIL
jgi:hemolysin III